MPPHDVMTQSPSPCRPEAAASSLVSVQDLHVRFTSREQTIYAVNGVSFSLQPGEVLCILGESGSGKSVTLRALMRLLPENRIEMDGKIRVGSRDVLALSERELGALRGAVIAMIFQEPITALDPVYTVGYQIAEAVVRHEGVSWKDADARALELFERVQIPSPQRRLKSYPHELSGGLRQRVMIALALSCRPDVLLADEPTTALDATVQIQILLLLRELQRELGMGVIFVTHDVGVAAEIADRLAIMYAGRFVETGPTRTVMREPRHPYTQGLLASTIRGEMRGTRIQAIKGSPPVLESLPEACSFAPRCPHADDTCLQGVPAEHALAPDHMARCVRLGEMSSP